MAAPRHTRKVAFPRGGPLGRRSAAAVVGLLGLLATALPIVAATTEYVVVDRNSGIAIHGFDPVAYFTDGAPLLGRGQFEHRHAGVVWRFRNSGNLGAFAANPDVYMPRFGGYDPVAVGRGAPVAGDPRIFMINDNRLYLFQTVENKEAFAANAEQAAAAAEEAWPSVLRTLVP